MKKILFIASLFLSLVSCDPAEVEIQESFDFEVKSIYENTNFAGVETATEVTIIPERTVTSTEYFISYEIIQGDGVFKQGTSTLTENQKYKLDDLQTNFTFTGTNIGENEIKLTITDNNEREVEHLLSYTIIDTTDFIFGASTSVTNLTVGETLPINFNLTSLENQLNEPITYTFSWSQTSLPGTFSFASSNLNLLENTSITEGNYSAEFVPGSSGTLELVFTVSASNGVSHSETITVEVEKTDFVLSIIPEETSDYVKDFTTFNFDISTLGVETLDYTIAFSGQYGEMLYNGTFYATGQPIPVNGGNFEMEYRANEITDEDLEFTVVASNGVTKTITTAYESLATEFEVYITPEPFSKLYVFDQNFTISIIAPPVDDYDLTYSFYYTSTVGAVNMSFNYINITGFTSPGAIINLGTTTYCTGNISQLGTLGPREGDLHYVFTDSNGMTFEKTIHINWYDF